MADSIWNPENRATRPNPSTSFAGPATEHATIGRSIVIKGELSGNEPLFVDGTVEGAIRFPEHRVTIGRFSKVAADITAKEVVVMGAVKGNINCGDLLDVRAESYIEGEITTQRIRIDDGAVLKGSVEVHKDKAASTAPPVPKDQPPMKTTEAVEAPKLTLAAAAAAAGIPDSAKRVAGSSVLLKPTN